MKYAQYVCLSLVLCMFVRMHATTWVVENTVRGDFLTVKEAVASANVKNGDTILLTSGQVFAGAGNSLVHINKNLIFDCTDLDADYPVIDLATSQQFFCCVDPGYTMTMRHIDVRNGSDLSGAALKIDNGATAYIEHCAFVNNRSVGGDVGAGGGAIENYGMLTLALCSFAGNRAEGSGGALLNWHTLVAYGCTFNDNNAYSGGALDASDGIAIVHGCRFVGNHADCGLGHAVVHDHGVIDVTSNWWSSSELSPSLFAGLEVDEYTPYLVAHISPDPLCVRLDKQELLSIDFVHNNAGGVYSGPIFDDMLINVQSSQASVTPSVCSVVRGYASVVLHDYMSKDAIPVTIQVDTCLSVSPYTISLTGIPTTDCAVYVSPTGKDSYSGTQKYPVKTIAYAVQLAHACGAQVPVLLQAGAVFSGAGNKNITLAQEVQFGRYGGAAADPIIDLEGSGLFCTLSSTASVAMHCLEIRNGKNASGGALNNAGLLTITNCTFKNNGAISGGVVFNHGTLSMTHSFLSGNCSESERGTIMCNDQRGVVSLAYNQCLHNGYGVAIYNEGGRVDARSNWWGSNKPDSHIIASGAAINYVPWATLSLSTEPAHIAPRASAYCTLDVANGYIPDGTPVVLSAVNADIMPKSTAFINGMVAARLTLHDTEQPCQLTALIGANPLASVFSQTIVPYVERPGIHIEQKINGAVIDPVWPALTVPLDSLCTLEYTVTNTGQLPLTNIKVIDSQGHAVVQPAIALEPGNSMLCTISMPAPLLHVPCNNRVAVTATTSDGREISDSVHLYVTAVPAGINMAQGDCIRLDDDMYQYTIEASNAPDLSACQLACLRSHAGITAASPYIPTLPLQEHVLVDAAVCNREGIAYIALLTHRHGVPCIVIATMDCERFVVRNIVSLPVYAKRLQWIAGSDNKLYLIVEEQDVLTLYAVDTEQYTLSHEASVANLAQGVSSQYIYGLSQGKNYYIVQGFNGVDIATYKVHFKQSNVVLDDGVMSSVNASFSSINEVLVRNKFLLFGGSSTESRAQLVRYSINKDGYLVPLKAYKVFPAATQVLSMQLCNDDSYLLIGTDKGLYVVQANTLKTLAFYIDEGTNWAKVCWQGTEAAYCTATTPENKTSIFAFDKDEKVLLKL